MKVSDANLVTPVYVRTEDKMPWPDDPVFYMLTSSGLFLCRNNEFVRSCAPVTKGPSELASVRALVSPRYPKLPRDLLERFVGFAEYFSKKHSTECGILLLWDRGQNKYRVCVPKQEVDDGLHLVYKFPDSYPPGCLLVGDIHSHAHHGVGSSWTDTTDEKYFPGIHIIVGRVSQEPPDISAEVIVDGTRFSAPLSMLCEGYRIRNRDVPEAWINQVTVKKVDYSGRGGSYYGAYGSSYDSGSGYGGFAVMRDDLPRGRRRRKKYKEWDHDYGRNYGTNYNGGKGIGTGDEGGDKDAPQSPPDAGPAKGGTT